MRSRARPRLLSHRPERERRRATFEEVPELYERARPGYPDYVFDDLVELAALPAAGRIVEIGPGTGQATQPLAERGFELTGVELGERLAALARRKLSRFPNVDIVNANFETWTPDVAGFDAVVAFTAFHWIDPELRFEKSSRLLRRGGALAVLATKHVLPPGGDSFWTEVQADYDAVLPSRDNRPPPAPEDVTDLSEEIDASGVLRTVAVRRYLWDLSYTADEYLAVLDTYSRHRTIEESKRRELYERIRRRIEERSGRSVRKTRLAMLNVARRP